jgi:dihydrofolate synthase/folylpolyglutamate synthase
MRDKDMKAVLEPFLTLVDAWYVGGVDSDRGATPESIASLLGDLGATRVERHPDIETATRAAQATSAERILAFGSFYTVGPAMETLRLY